MRAIIQSAHSRVDHQPGRIARFLFLMLSVVLIAASCSTTSHPPMRPTSTGKTIKTASTTVPDSSPVISSTLNSGPGVTDIEIFEGTGVFINEEAAERAPEVVAADGEIVLNFEGESIQSVVHTILGEVLQETFVIGPGVAAKSRFPLPGRSAGNS